MADTQSAHRIELSFRNVIILSLGLVVTAFLALGSHDVAIAHLGIPSPNESAVPAWAKYIGQIVRLASMVYACHLASWYLDRRSTLVAATIFGILIVLFQETFRVIVMDNVVSDGWIDLRWLYLLMIRLPNVLLSFYSGVVAVVVARHLKKSSPARMAIVIAVAAATGLFVIIPVFKAATDTIITSFHLTVAPEIHRMPYGIYVYKYIYGMFIEPTIAAFVLAYLLLPALQGSKFRRIFVFTLVLLLIRGRVIGTGMFSFWIDGRWPMAVASEGQFFVETLVLAGLTGLIWASVTPSIMTAKKSAEAVLR